MGRHFSRKGALEDLKIVKTPSQKTPFAFVWFRDLKDAERAVEELNGSYLSGDKLKVMFAREENRRRGLSRSRSPHGDNTSRNGRGPPVIHGLVHQYRGLEPEEPRRGGGSNLPPLSWRRRDSGAADGDREQSSARGRSRSLASSPASHREQQRRSPSRSASSDRPEAVEDRRPSASSTGYRIVIENMPEDMTQEELADLASDFGTVRSAQVSNSKEDSNSLIGRVEFNNEADMRNAIKELDKRRIEGHSLKLKAYQATTGYPDMESTTA